MYTRQLAILFPAVLVVAVFMLIKPDLRPSPIAIRPPEPTTSSNDYPRRYGSEAEHQRRTERWQIIQDFLIDRGTISPDMPQEEVRQFYDNLRRSDQEASEQDKELLKAINIRLLESGHRSGRWGRHRFGSERNELYSLPSEGYFEGQGLTLHDEVPDLSVFDLNGQPVVISESWKGKPLLLVTGSLTCGETREHIAELDALSRRYANPAGPEQPVHVVLLYTLEAMPNDEDAPGPAGEALAARYGSSDIPSRPQPKTLQQRLELANELRETLDVQTTILVDSMDNAGWQAFGQAPSMAVLVTPDGKIEHKLGWFDAYEVSRTIDRLFEQPSPNPTAFQ